MRRLIHAIGLRWNATSGRVPTAAGGRRPPSGVLNGGVTLLAILALAAATVLAVTSVYAAKNPDKVPDKVFDKPIGKRAEKLERKLERAAAVELASPVDARRVSAAPAPMAQPSPDRSRPERSSRRGSTEYREPTTPADSKYDSFRVIVERNIFNPTRVGRTRDREEKAPRVDTIALVGTMQYDKGVVAFFDSPDAAFRKTLREGQSVGDFKVQKIAPNEVELIRDGKPISLRVAQQLRRPEGGDWSVTAAEPPRDATGAAATAGGRPPEPAEPPPIPADASDVVKRMMEQRQKQLKN